MRILLASDFYPPTIGGLETHVETLAQKLKANGHEVAVITSRNAQRRPSANDPIIYTLDHVLYHVPLVYSNSEQFRYIPPVSDPVLLGTIRNVIEDFRPEIIHSHGWITFAIANLRRNNNIPSVATLHDYGFICPKRTLYVEKTQELCPLLKTDHKLLRPELICVPCSREMYGLSKSPFVPAMVGISRHYLPSMDRYIAVSEHVRRIAIRSGLENISVIPNFIDTKKYSSEAERNDETGQNVLYIGTLNKNKGVHVLIKAFKELQENGGGIRLTLIGKSSSSLPSHYLRQDFIDLIENASNQVRNTNLASCRFLVVPSVWPEPFGIAALEAMSFGKPVIASNTGGLPEIVRSGENGILVEPGDHLALARAITTLYRDQGEILRMGKNAARLLRQNFDSEIVIPRIEHLYEEMLK